LTTPEVQRPRLLLRGWRGEDLDGYAAMDADPEVMRFMGGPVDRVESWRRLAMFAGHWVLRGYGTWAVERTEDGVLVGRIGLWEPEGWPGLEVGWKLARHAWGHGYATEAARASIEWGWATLDVPRLISLIHPENEASIRVAGRLGMRPIGEHDVGSQRVIVFGLDRPDRPHRPDRPA
jgi:RimJ/RimL family protein N-acetyltransferase